MTSIHSIKIQVLRFKISTVTVPTKSCDSHSLHRHDQILEKCHDRNAKKNTTKISSINERRQWHRLLWISNIRDVMTHFKLVNRRIKGRRIPIRRTKNMYILSFYYTKKLSPTITQLPMILDDLFPWLRYYQVYSLRENMVMNGQEEEPFLSNKSLDRLNKLSVQ